jgi:predicted molibdopterin-dependent oxidoreductase YjgC
MKTTPAMRSLQIDERTLLVKPGRTILQAAEDNQVYIPHLCAHKDLLPFGGCRLCLVEVEGFRNFAPACTTPVEDGMVVRTKTPEVQHLRGEVLKLILSEHPSNCLFCKEGKDCALYMDTLRKVATITGCRACPDDGQCELQDVVEYVGITEVEFPLIYRNYPVEDYDPFYDRDYNLCILCGRCIGACQHYRLAEVLTFKHRGHETLVGPAFDRSHIEAGCEFCGSCVAICPTGTLSEKTRKWEGKPEREVQTTCPFCGLGCQIQLLVIGKEVVGSLAVDDSLPGSGPTVNHGQLCLKGRFAAYEVLNHPDRLTVPYRLEDGIRQVLSWSEALDLAAEKLAGCEPDDFAMLVSPDCTNEELYLAQKFTRSVMYSGNIDTTSRSFYGAGFNAYIDLLRLSAPLSVLEKATVILSVGLDTQYNRSVVGVEIKKALHNGAKLVTIHPRDHNLALHAETWIQPQEGEEAGLLQELSTLLKQPQPRTGKPGAKQHSSAPPSQVAQVARLLRRARRVAILVGSEYLQHSNAPKILEDLRALALQLKADVLPLPAQANLVGSIQMGCYSELLPGGFPVKDEKQRAALQVAWGVKIPKSDGWNSQSVSRKLKVLYVVGALPPLEVEKAAEHNRAEFILYQNVSELEGLPAPALVLPSAAFAEMDGTLTSGEGRIQPVNKAVEPPGWALPGWTILSRLAQTMGKPGFDFTRASQVRREISQLAANLGSFRRTTRKPTSLEAQGKLELTKPATASPVGEGWRLYSHPDENTYQGFPLTAWVGGMQMLFDDRCVEIHPEDARWLGVSEEDVLLISGGNFELERAARLCESQPLKTLRIQTLRVSETLRVLHVNGLPISGLPNSGLPNSGLPNSGLPISVTVRKKDV